MVYIGILSTTPMLSHVKQNLNTLEKLCVCPSVTADGGWWWRIIRKHALSISQGKHESKVRSPRRQYQISSLWWWLVVAEFNTVLVGLIPIYVALLCVRIYRRSELEWKLIGMMIFRDGNMRFV